MDTTPRKISIATARKRLREGNFPFIEMFTTKWDDGAYINAATSLDLVREGLMVLPTRDMARCTAPEAK